MFLATGGEVEPGGLDAGVAEDVGEAGEVAGLLIITEGEKAAQIVGKDAVRIDGGTNSKSFEQGPDLITGIGAIVFGAKEGTMGDLLFFAKVRSFLQRDGTRRMVRILPLRRISARPFLTA